MPDIPAAVKYGRLVARAVRFWADSPDPGQVPDELTLSGTITLTPQVGVMRWPGITPPRLAVVEALPCPVIDGDLYPPGTTPEALPEQPGVVLVASVQPDGEPDRIPWTASFQLTDEQGRALPAQPPPVDFEVPDGDTVDLATVVPTQPAPGTVTIVSSADRIAAQAAAEQATEAAARAEHIVQETTKHLGHGDLTWAGDVDLTDLADGPAVLRATLTGDVVLHMPTPDPDHSWTVTLLLRTIGEAGGLVQVPGALSQWGQVPQVYGTSGSATAVTLLWTGAEWIIAPPITYLLPIPETP